MARHKIEAEQELAASEFGSEADDPFAALGDNDDQDSSDPFSLDEEEQDITAFGKRNTTQSFSNNTEESHGFSVSRGLTSLFAAGGSSQPQTRSNDDFGESLGDSSSEGTDSDVDPEHPPLEARRSLERRPLDIDDDDDEEMGEMVAPNDESNSSDEEEEVLSAQEKERLGGSSNILDAESPSSEFAGQADQDDDGDDDALVEITMPSAKRLSRG